MEGNCEHMPWSKVSFQRLTKLPCNTIVTRTYHLPVLIITNYVFYPHRGSFGDHTNKDMLFHVEPLNPNDNSVRKKIAWYSLYIIWSQVTFSF